MVFSLTWMPEVLQRAGLKISETPDWRTRGRGDMGRVRGVMIHHTAGAAQGNMPSLDLLIRGRPDLNGPLAQLGLGRDGTFYVLAAGRANHAGGGVWSGVETGNSSFIGIEAENTGKPNDEWPDVQREALRRGVAALLKHIGTDASMVCGHKEFALPKGRKTDPLFSMPEFRESVAALMAAGSPPAPLIPASDGAARPTLRRGATGPFVKQLQAALALKADGDFGAGTEAALRRFQRDHGVVPDGICGPKTWLLLAASSQASAKPVVAPAPVKPAAPPAAAPSAAVVPKPTQANAAPAVAKALKLPPISDPQHPVTVSNNRAVSPDGRIFATKFKLGFSGLGSTSARAFLQADPTAGQGLLASALRAVSAVTVNEGGLEAVNSWDAAFMSFGIMQWTIGTGDNPGELAVLLGLIKRNSPDAFRETFGRFGIDVAITATALTGQISLGGKILAKAADKAVLRSPEWAYRFWRAGHDPAVRRSQLSLAVSRIGRFADLAIQGQPVRQWLSSELGMAMLLDQHINRPGHVPATLDTALAALLTAGSVPKNPANWKQADEQLLIERYLTLRARTSMTSSQERAMRLFEQSHQGLLSVERGSF